MTSLKIQTTLENMKGKLFSHNLKEHRVLRFTVSDHRMKVVTDRSDFDVPLEHAKDLLEDFLPIDESKPFLPAARAERRDVALMPQTSISANAAKLSEIILGNIEKVKEDPAYIPQANAINDQLKSLIELGKAEVEGMKVQVMLQKMQP